MKICPVCNGENNCNYCCDVCWRELIRLKEIDDKWGTPELEIYFSQYGNKIILNERGIFYLQ